MAICASVYSVHIQIIETWIRIRNGHMRLRIQCPYPPPLRLRIHVSIIWIWTLYTEAHMAIADSYPAQNPIRLDTNPQVADSYPNVWGFPLLKNLGHLSRSNQKMTY
jgi:hypothetical protein